MSVYVSYKKQTVFFIVMISLALVTVEGFVRIWWDNIESCAFENSDVYKELPISLKRQMCIESYHVKYSPERIEPNQEYQTININSFGFRGKDVSIEKPENLFRIFALGGSTMYGVGSTSDITTIPGFLQQKFNEEITNKKIEVINAGVSDGWSQTETNLIKTSLLDFNPDLLIIYDGWNDAQNIAHIQDDKVHEKISLWVKRWSEICELGKERGFKTIIIIQPLVGTGNKTLTQDEYRNFVDLQKTNILPRLEMFALALKELDSCTSTADLRESFNGFDIPIFWDQGHMGNSGNEIIAQKMFEVILPHIENNSTKEVMTSKHIQHEKTSGDTTFNDTYALLKRNVLQNYKTPMLLKQIFVQSQEQLIKNFDPIKKESKNLNLDSDLSYADLSMTFYPDTDFSNKNLIGVDFFGAYLRESSFINSNLSYANMTFSNLSISSMESANLQNTDLRKSDLSSANLQKVDLRGANLRGAKLFNTNLQGADLQKIDLTNANLRFTDLTGSNLNEANLSGLDMRLNVLINANLNYANLSGSFLNGQTIVGMTIKGADLSGVTLYQGGDFSNKDLTKTDFSYSYLFEANFSNANITEANFEGAILDNVDFKDSNLEDALGGPFVGCVNHPLCN